MVFFQRGQACVSCVQCCQSFKQTMSFFCGHVGLLSSVFGSNDGCFNISQPLSSYNDVCENRGRFAISAIMKDRTSKHPFISSDITYSLRSRDVPSIAFGKRWKRRCLYILMIPTRVKSPSRYARIDVIWCHDSTQNRIMSELTMKQYVGQMDSLRQNRWNGMSEFFGAMITSVVCFATFAKWAPRNLYK